MEIFGNPITGYRTEYYTRIIEEQANSYQYINKRESENEKHGNNKYIKRKEDMKTRGRNGY